MLQVAIKKINAVFENPIVAWRTLREVRVTLHGTVHNSCDPDLVV